MRCAYVRSAGLAAAKIEARSAERLRPDRDRKSRAALRPKPQPLPPAPAAQQPAVRRRARRLRLGDPARRDGRRGQGQGHPRRGRRRSGARWPRPRPLPRRSCGRDDALPRPLLGLRRSRTTRRRPASTQAQRLRLLRDPELKIAERRRVCSTLSAVRSSGSRVEYQRCRLKRTSLAWLTRAARYVDPPWSGWSFFISVAMRLADLVGARPRLKAQDLVGFLFRHRAGVRPRARPRVRVALSVFTPAGKPAVEISL